MNARSRLYTPGFLHFTLVPGASVVGDVSEGTVDGGEVRFADIQEVGSHPTHRHLGDVRERLADGTAEQEHAYLQDDAR